MKQFIDRKQSCIRLCRLLTAWALLVSTSVAEDSLQNAKKNEFLTRQQAWQAKLKSSHALFDYVKTLTLFNSLKHLKGDLPLHIVYNPKEKWTLDFQFSTKDGQSISLLGHKRSSFCSKNQRLYFADFWPNESGCSIVAFDLVSGKELWRTKLHQEQPKGASGYQNFVMLSMPPGPYTPDKEPEESGAVVEVRGSETYCDYIEVLDAETGSSLAIRNYRVGFEEKKRTWDEIHGRTKKGPKKSTENERKEQRRGGF